MKSYFVREFTESVCEEHQGKKIKIESAKINVDIGPKNSGKKLVKHEEEIDKGMPMPRVRVFSENRIIVHDEKEFEAQSNLV